MRLDLCSTTNDNVNLATSRTCEQGDALVVLNLHLTSVCSLDSEKCNELLYL